MGVRLKEKIAIVTGGTSGIGRATAEIFAGEGAKVIVAARREEKGAEVIEKIRAAGGTADFVKTDITVEKDLDNLVETAIDKYGRIDILVNNAGVASQFEMVNMNIEEDYDKVFNTNVRAYFLLSQKVLPYMLEQKKGSIVNISSASANVGLPYCTAYSASKGAVKMFTKSLAAELGKTGVRVNAILPGVVTSDMVSEDSNYGIEMAKATPMGKLGRPEDIGYGVLYLASDESAYCTGTSLVIDGGLTSI